ncbi:polysaccharide deacetylase family protein [Clostridium sp. LBM24168]
MRKRRKTDISKVYFTFVVAALFFLSTVAGFKIAQQSSRIRDRKIAASNIMLKKEDAAKKVEKQADGNNLSDDKLPEGRKVAYLTFDDGPSANVTPQILSILKKYDIRATFFVIGSMARENPELLKREKAEGHSIGNHTYSHNYEYLYSNPQNFLDDLKKNENIIHSVIGDFESELIRFPGGSFGRTLYKKAAENEGYVYVDWNEETGDGRYHHPTVEMLVNNFKKYYTGNERMVILMHDAATKQTTVQALPIIIKMLKDDGYVFRPITKSDYEFMKKMFHN